MMGSSDIEGDNLAVKVDHAPDLLLLFLPDISLPLDSQVLLVEVPLHVEVVPVQEVVVDNQLIPNALVLHGLFFEEIANSAHVVLENAFDLSDSLLPSGFDLTNLRPAGDIDPFRQIHQESSLQRVLRIDDLFSGVLWVIWASLGGGFQMSIFIFVFTHIYFFR